MKRILVYCTLALSLLPIQLSYSMEREGGQNAQNQELSYFDRLKRYFNIMSFSLRLAAISSDQAQNGPKTKGIETNQCQDVLKK